MGLNCKSGNILIGILVLEDLILDIIWIYFLFFVFFYQNKSILIKILFFIKTIYFKKAIHFFKIFK